MGHSGSIIHNVVFFSSHCCLDSQINYRYPLWGGGVGTTHSVSVLCFVMYWASVPTPASWPSSRVKMSSHVTQSHLKHKGLYRVYITDHLTDAVGSRHLPGSSGLWASVVVLGLGDGAQGELHWTPAHQTEVLEGISLPSPGGAGAFADRKGGLEKLVEFHGRIIRGGSDLGKWKHRSLHLFSLGCCPPLALCYSVHYSASFRPPLLQPHSIKTLSS